MSLPATYRYEDCHEALGTVLLGLSILSGEQMGPTGMAWQDVARLTACGASALASLLHAAAAGSHGSFPSFPEPGEVLGEVDEAGSDFGVTVRP